ncbi:rod shape-determining protein MreD [Sedimentibacter sp. zth1]|uniref:rod shape-determining protein MreD n=1 Tax=Sedimentibacter sp. zth1 TaxID=2816908 RepID=UPI001A92C7D8|nr:rod shape-determining protein MreD [Sedimentibacter sp. zth1]QSX06210.1 rod shape-determining protein MreD [Sedimentibacter sp. zth1]
MKRMYMFLIVFINLILQVSLYNFLKIFDVIPNIALILVVIFSLSTDDITGGLIGLITGLLYDVLIMDVIGINALIYFIVGVSLGSLSEDVNRENKMLFALITAIATVFYHLLTFIALFFLKVNASSVALIFNKIILQIVLNTLFCILLYKLLELLFNLFKIKLFDDFYRGE